VARYRAEATHEREVPGLPETVTLVTGH
jgi:hypothetical protein